MKYKIFLLLLILFISSCTTTAPVVSYDSGFDKRLLGKWQSDRVRTLRWIEKNRKFTQEQIDRIDSTVRFGNLILEITKGKTRITYNGETREEENRIIGTVSDDTALVVCNPITDQDEIRIIRVEDDNTYSIYIDYFDIREYFKKIE